MVTINARSYGVVPIDNENSNSPLFLILRAYNNWDFPKGGADLGETPLQAAIRELKEETGLDQFSLYWDEQSIDTQVYSNGKVATYFIAKVRYQELTLPINPQLGKPEHNEYRWASYVEARELLPARLIPILDWANLTLSK
jgi:bis(5'-nucleosidyl)-tetraphosphatase